MLLAVKRFRAAQMNGLSLLCGNLHLVIDGDLVLNDHIADDDCPPLDQHLVVEQNRTTSQLRSPPTIARCFSRQLPSITAFSATCEL